MGWADRAADIRAMAAAGAGDREIGDRYGVSGSRICTVRKTFGIPAGRPSHGRRYPQSAEQPSAPETRTEGGVTYCPPRYAEGATAGATARPRRG